jgi:hypothetical protein
MAHGSWLMAHGSWLMPAPRCLLFEEKAAQNPLLLCVSVPLW